MDCRDRITISIISRRRCSRRIPQGVVRFVGEPRPDGLAGQILSPSGGTVTHFDRFYLPSIVEVEYRIGEENHIILNGAITPHGDHDVTPTAITDSIGLHQQSPLCSKM